MQPVVLKYQGFIILYSGLYVSDEVHLPMDLAPTEISRDLCREMIPGDKLVPLKLWFCGQKLPDGILYFAPQFLEHLKRLHGDGKINRIWQLDRYLSVSLKETLSLAG